MIGVAHLDGVFSRVDAVGAVLLVGDAAKDEAWGESLRLTRAEIRRCIDLRTIGGALRPAAAAVDAAVDALHAAHLGYLDACARMVPTAAALRHVGRCEAALLDLMAGDGPAYARAGQVGR